MMGHEHEWIETYYGVECGICGLFIPDGMGPWMPVDDDYEGPDLFDPILDDDFENGK